MPNIEQICQTIIQQLAGNYSRLHTMTGVKHLVSDNEKKSLTLVFPARITKFNYITITLLPSDTYHVKFMKFVGVNLKKEVEFSDIYAENLKELVENQTGMRLSL